MVPRDLMDSYLARLCNHQGAYYRQWCKGTEYGYCAIREPVTPELLSAHLRGAITIACPALDENNLGKWLCFDSDRESDDLDRIQTFLEQYCWHIMREGARPGRNGHLWLLFDACIPGEQLRIFGKTILKFAGVNDQDVELFPKQDRATTLASGVRAPLGIHRKPGADNARGWFDGPAKDIKSQLEWLAVQPLNSAAAAMELAYKHRPVPKPYVIRTTPSSNGDGVNFVEYAQSNGFKQYGGEHIGPCPACKLVGHDTTNDHLSINASNGLVNCWRGCKFIDILRAIKGTRCGAA